MQKTLLLFSIILLLAGCAKEKGCTPVEPKAEEPKILAFAAANAVDSLKVYNGVYYRIVEAGQGKTPQKNSTVSVTYSGKLLNGTQFTEVTTPSDLNLESVIEGWQIGLSLLKEGGRIKLLIPSSYGYVCLDIKDNNQNVIIPSNSVLYYDITLVKVY